MLIREAANVLSFWPLQALLRILAENNSHDDNDDEDDGNNHHLKWATGKEREGFEGKGIPPANLIAAGKV